MPRRNSQPKAPSASDSLDYEEYLLGVELAAVMETPPLTEPRLDDRRPPATPDASRNECDACGRAKYAATICSCDDAMQLEQLDSHPAQTIGTLLAPNNTGQDAWYRFGAERTRMDLDQQAS